MYGQRRPPPRHALQPQEVRRGHRYPRQLRPPLLRLRTLAYQDPENRPTGANCSNDCRAWIRRRSLWNGCRSDCRHRQRR
ncbi:hypothetical protein LINPERPRIM_LOCUS2871 [Linum perenne]